MAKSAAPRRRTANGVERVVALSVSGYKSLCHDTRIEIAPLTILAGANSSGKSSAIQPLLLLKQTLDSPHDPGPLLLNGPNVKFTRSEQLLSHLLGEAGTQDAFSVSIELRNAGVLTVTFRKVKAEGLGIHEMVHVHANERTVLRLGMSSEEIAEAMPKEVTDFLTSILSIKDKRMEMEVGRTRCFLHFGPILPGSLVERLSVYRFSPSGPFQECLENAIHVPGLRGNPERTYETTAIGPKFPGTFEKYVASVVNDWQLRDQGKLARLESWLKALGLTWRVTAKPVDETHVELKVGRLLRSARGGAHDLVSIADVGFGVSQVLPVLVALITARSGQLVYLEQPEIHLHPKAQLAMAGILADAARRGVVVVAETHSELLLRGVQSLVAEGRLNPGLVRLHWFRRDRNGVTSVDSASLDHAGAFGDWPEDFGQVSLNAESSYLDAAEKRRRAE